MTNIDMVPSFFSFFLESGIALPALRRINLGGEAVTRRLVHRSQCRFAARVFVTYGPTEAAVDATTWAAPEGVTPTSGAPLGRPDAYRALDVDDELRISGLGLGRYVRGCFGVAARGAGRRYDTGDVVRWGTEGLEFLGRKDSQVKLHGQRVELEEIESALRMCPEVAEAAVLLTHLEASEPMLVAFYSPPGTAPELPLPRHMQPRLFSRSNWPRSPTGKLDRRRLAREARELLEAPRVADLTGYSEKAKSFLELLTGLLRKDLDLTQSFTRLGGDSVLAIRISAKLREKGVHLTPMSLLTNAALQDLAQMLGEVVVKPASGPVEGEVPLAPMQRRFFDLNLQHPQHYNQSMMLLPSFPLDVEMLHKGLIELAQHHDMLRASCSGA